MNEDSVVTSHMSSVHPRGLANRFTIGRVVAHWYTLLAFVGVCVVVFGLRDYHIGVDTPRYFRTFNWLSVESFGSIVEHHMDKDVGFYLISKVFIGLFGIRGTFVLYALLLATSIAMLVRTVHRRRSFLAIAIYLTLPALYSLGANVMRHGVAVSFLLFATSFFLERRWIGASVCAMLSLLMHASALIYIVAGLVAMTLTIRQLILVFTAAVLASAAGIGLHHVDPVIGVDLVGMIAGDRFDGYLYSGGHAYRTGFRLDFILYTVAPLFVAAISFRGISSDFVGNLRMSESMIKIYLALSVVFVLSFVYPYSDRIGIFAWILIPLLITQPGAHRMTSGYRFLWAVGVLVIVLANIFVRGSSKGIM